MSNLLPHTVYISGLTFPENVRKETLKFHEKLSKKLSYCSFQVAQMTKSELESFDPIFLAPLCLFVNQIGLLGTTFSEVRILWVCWVSYYLLHKLDSLC